MMRGGTRESKIVLGDRCSAPATVFATVAKIVAGDQLTRKGDHAAEASVEASL